MKEFQRPILVIQTGEQSRYVYPVSIGITR